MNTAFAKQLEDSIATDCPEPSLLRGLRREIDNIIATNNATAASKRTDLDQQGTRLWNLASKVKNIVKDEECICSSRIP